MRAKNQSLLYLGVFALLAPPIAQAKDACLQLAASPSPARADDCNVEVAAKLKAHKKHLKEFLYRNGEAGIDPTSMRKNLASLKRLSSQIRRVLADANQANEAQQEFARKNAESANRENLLGAQLAHAARNIGEVQSLSALIARLESTTKEATDAIAETNKLAKATAARATRVALD